ncbi:ribonuclease E inhibitor RraB [Acinetobacter sp. ANC 4173]|jgi:regulator of RNase E activity RraB|uniref:ribonuclease E inhibitor RraB n=1 Tax=Acinetobacter sp. ANC 4173 TaxID=2529837 RepID=UPI0010390311|nr:ribonuclease E inhibitor RraB [Acinetobacter sp. ANC 4173]TCB78498.1 ribonuclease E inhibitor RraB [Acinetobacter sp. ANC 4173]
MSRNYELFPDDDNGNVLWQMYEDGNDLTDLHEIEFSIVFTTQDQAEKCAVHLLHEEQKISLFQEEVKNDGSDLWVLNVHVNMIPEYQDVQDLEEWFVKIAEMFQGEYDGWGCLSYLYDYDDE